MQTWSRWLRISVACAALALACIGLSWPEASPDLRMPAETTAFRWDADGLFEELEAEFVRTGTVGLTEATAQLDGLLEDGGELLDQLRRSGRMAQGAPVAEGGRVAEGLRVAEAEQAPLEILGRVSTLQFELAVLGAAHPSLLPSVSAFFVDARLGMMSAATAWRMDRTTHEAIYRVLFGGRIGLDEALVQAGADATDPLLRMEDVPSRTPSTVIQGVRIHSGDVLLSRGGAPTSALIARGNDFPNTFSHSALIHVDSETGDATVLESLIETGSTLTSVEEYMDRTNHRILLLRLRPEHPALVEDSQLPHRAAEALLLRLREEHIPYDFAMDWEDPSAAFCSEVIYHAFLERGVELWTLRSSITSAGLVRWLGGMGVRRFTSLVPSDLEFDPHLVAVVEWRNAPALMDYRFDNAIIDALVEEADAGADLGYGWHMLPLGRLLKAFSVLQSRTGFTPTIPTGMSASTALRVDALVSTVQPTIKDELVDRATSFRDLNGYEPPYWTLVELARESLEEVKPELHPALSSR